MNCAVWPSTAAWTLARISASARAASRSFMVIRRSLSTSSSVLTSVIFLELFTLCVVLASATGLRSSS